MSEILNLIKAFFLGIKEGFSDLVFWNKEPRERPIERLDTSWKKYYKYPEWRAWGLKEITAQIVIILVLLIIIRESVGEFRYIPSESMEPTMKVGDKLFVEKFTKWFRGGKYERGDIIIFYPPKEATDGKDVLHNDPFSIFARLTGLPFLPQPEAYIKRIVGLPGDKIRVIKNQGVFINSHPLQEPYHVGSIDYLPEYSLRERVVPPGHYFVLGDNRNYSKDSSSWGYLPQSRVIGRAAFLFFRALNEKPIVNPAIIDPELKP
jgi:signal peptidase I